MITPVPSSATSPTKMSPPALTAMPIGDRSIPNAALVQRDMRPPSFDDATR
jgi:hypothetical protein